MVDTVSPEVRSRMMAAVKGKDTKPEVTLRKALHALGYRYRLHKRIGKARPDVTLARYSATIFVHGCFWHGHDLCRLSRMPKSNVTFWSDKIGRNRRRDKDNIEELEATGWRVAVVWECAMRDLGAQAVAEALQVWLTSGSSEIELRGPRFADGERQK